VYRNVRQVSTVIGATVRCFELVRATQRLGRSLLWHMFRI